MALVAVSGPGHRADDEVNALRVPPNSMEAEQGVLGALLLDNAAFDQVGPMLAPADFYAADHRAIYAGIVALLTAGKTADIITVFEATGHALAYLNSLTQSVVWSSGARAHAEIVRERALRRRLITIAQGLLEGAWQTGERAPSVQDVADRSVTALVDLLQQQAGNDEPRPIADLLAGFVDDLNDRFEGRTNAVATGLADLDALLGGGFRPGELIVLGARPSMGKTALTLTLCRNISTQHPVLAMTMEDSLMSQVSRLVAAAGRVNMADIRNPQRAPDSMWAGVTEGVDTLSRAMIDLDETACMTLLDVRRKIQQCQRRRGQPLGLVVIDYLQLMDGQGDNPNQVLGAIAKGLKRAAKELRVPIVLLSQLNREADKRTGPPQMSDLRDSGDIEGAADIIGLLYREHQRKPSEGNKHQAELHVVKNKNGETRHLEFHFDGQHQRFENAHSGGY